MATAPITTVLFTRCPIKWRNVMELIQNWDNQDQQAKSFQMRYNLSKLNNWNYQTLMPLIDFKTTLSVANSHGRCFCEMFHSVHLWWKAYESCSYYSTSCGLGSLTVFKHLMVAIGMRKHFFVSIINYCCCEQASTSDMIKQLPRLQWQKTLILTFSKFLSM